MLSKFTKPNLFYLKIIRATSILFLLTISTSFKNDKYDSFYLEINQSWNSDDWRQNRTWIVHSHQMIYTKGCKSDTFIIKNLYESQAFYKILDSLKFYKDYACKGVSGLHSNAKFKLIGSWTHNDNKGYFNFSITNCQLNNNLDSLVNLLNSYIPKDNEAVIPKIQEGFGECKCKAYNEVKVFEE